MRSLTATLATIAWSATVVLTVKLGSAPVQFLKDDVKTAQNKDFIDWVCDDIFTPEICNVL